MEIARNDPATFSNFNDVVATHYDLHWNVNFEQRRMEGSVKISLDVQQDTSKVILDGRGLEIQSISIVDGEVLKFGVETEDVRGQKITIDLPATLPKGQKVIIQLNYNTANEATALQFLNKEQTTDKIGPFLFSQCQAIHARSIVPCMDTPSVKATYAAQVEVPTGMKCLMSAITEGSNVVEGKSTTVFSFNQSVAIPSYLIAIVVGHMEQRAISSRCAVWSEPSIADGAAWEFEGTEKFLSVAEDIAGPYLWGRYDMVVLPATFPFGGMENPCLTFITPTLLAGDRSLVNVVAHEISHSWTGNLVTNSSWEHFWLNEGFTVFLERKIHGRLHGEAERQFESERGWAELTDTVNNILGPVNEYTKLVQNQAGVDPDDAFCNVPYEKGSAFLLHLEQALGKDRFEAYLKDYIQTFKNKSINTYQWKDHLYSCFHADKSKLDDVDWDLWLNQPGLPTKPQYDSTLMKECRALCDAWVSATPPTDGARFDKMSASEKEAVLECIRATGKFEEAKMPSLTKTYSLNTAKNCELRFQWLMLGLENRWQPIIEPALAMALAVGRMKYCKPIYKELFKWPLSSKAAVDQFKKNIPFMHPITASVITKLLPK